MKTGIEKRQEIHYIMIGLLMALLGLVFIFYIETNLYHSSKRFFQKNSVMETMASTDDFTAVEP